MYKNSVYQPQFTHDDIEILEQKWLYRGFVQVELSLIRHRLFTNQEFSPVLKREIVHRREAAGVFVHDPQLKKFLLIEQFRLGAIHSKDTPWQLEIIAGLVDEGEDAVSCLKREALEEAGCVLQDLQFVHQYYPSTGASDELFSLYAATADLSQSGGIFGEESEGEDIKVHLFDYQDIDDLLSNGYVRNAALIIALQWFQLYLHQLP